MNPVCVLRSLRGLGYWEEMRCGLGEGKWLRCWWMWSNKGTCPLSLGCDYWTHQEWSCTRCRWLGMDKYQVSCIIEGLVQERCNSIANALELHLSCTNSSIYIISGLRSVEIWDLSPWVNSMLHLPPHHPINPYELHSNTPQSSFHVTPMQKSSTSVSAVLKLFNPSRIGSEISALKVTLEAQFLIIIIALPILKQQHIPIHCYQT